MDTNSPKNPHLRTKLVPPNKTGTLEPSPDSDCSDKRSIACWRKYQDNKKKYIEEEFVQSGPVRLLEAVYCDPCKAKVFNFDELNLQSIEKAIDHFILNQNKSGKRVIFCPVRE